MVVINVGTIFSTTAWQFLVVVCIGSDHRLNSMHVVLDV